MQYFLCVIQASNSTMFITTILALVTKEVPSCNCKKAAPDIYDILEKIEAYHPALYRIADYIQVYGEISVKQTTFILQRQ